MLKKLSKPILIILALTLILCLCGGAFATGTPTVSLGEVRATPGSTITVPVTISSNPGLASMKLLITYDASVLTCVDAEIAPAFKDISGAVSVVTPEKNPAILLWVSPNGETKTNGTFATLTFTVANDADGKESALRIIYDEDDVYNGNEDNVALAVQDGKVTVSAHIPGDINGDGKVNNKDLTRLAQYLAGKNVVIY